MVLLGQTALNASLTLVRVEVLGLTIKYVLIYV